MFVGKFTSCWLTLLYIDYVMSTFSQSLSEHLPKSARIAGSAVPQETPR